MSDIVKWGMIGAGNVAEVKSGPAFQKAENSELAAVMRRTAEKAEDFARRHRVPRWYSDAGDLLSDDSVNAVYIATPPAFHLELAKRALTAGKNVYLEKPMCMNTAESDELVEILKGTDLKLTVAHYRRRLPAFMKIKELIDSGRIGDVRFVQIRIFQPAVNSMIADSEENWRTDPAISGGGYFHDVAPHQIDLMLYFFGEFIKAEGFSANQAGIYEADDIVSGSGSDEVFSFTDPENVQLPMIADTVLYFRGETANPCPAEACRRNLQIMDAFTRSVI